jgi:hypothetical protein
MAKSALGRGLQHLMKERPSPRGQENPAEKASVTPGMAALLSGGNGHAKDQQPAPADAQNLATAVRKRKLIQASMFIADSLLIGLVARLAFVSHGHFGLVEVALCTLAVAIGAWLSCLALWMK